MVEEQIVPNNQVHEAELSDNLFYLGNSQGMAHELHKGRMRNLQDFHL